MTGFLEDYDIMQEAETGVRWPMGCFFQSGHIVAWKKIKQNLETLQGKIVNKYLIVQPGVCSREQTTSVGTYKVECPNTTSYRTEACVPLQQR